MKHWKNISEGLNLPIVHALAGAVNQTNFKGMTWKRQKKLHLWYKSVFEG